MSPCAPPAAPISMRAASRWNRAASAAIGGVIVADSISVCRPGGNASRIAARSSRNPMSSMSSASSTTTQPRFAVTRVLRAIWSRSRPGVPTTMSSPRASAARSAAISAPPVQQPMRAPVAANSQPSSRPTCVASSRVGVRITARGPAVATKRPSGSNSRRPSARPMATVFPDPVGAETSRSASGDAASRIAVCTGVKVVNPRAPRLCASVTGTRSLPVIVTHFMEFDRGPETAPATEFRRRPGRAARLGDLVAGSTAGNLPASELLSIAGTNFKLMNGLRHHGQDQWQ